MSWQLLIGHLLIQLALVGITVLIHATSMLLVLRYFVQSVPSTGPHVSFHRLVVFLFYIVCMILTAHVVEMVVWGLTFHLLGIFPNPFTAYYFAIETYTTLGYGDVLLPDAWRLTSGWLATTGLLMFGWSTAVFATVVNRLNEGRMQTMAARRALTDDHDWVTMNGLHAPRS